MARLLHLLGTEAELSFELPDIPCVEGGTADGMLVVNNQMYRISYIRNI